MQTVSPEIQTTRRALRAAQLSYVCASGGSEFSPGVMALDAASRTLVYRFRFPGGGSPHSVAFDP
jgi:hypothetical protein